MFFFFRAGSNYCLCWLLSDRRLLDHLWEHLLELLWELLESLRSFGSRSLGNQSGDPRASPSLVGMKRLWTTTPYPTTMTMMINTKIRMLRMAKVIRKPSSMSVIKTVPMLWLINIFLSVKVIFIRIVTSFWQNIGILVEQRRSSMILEI